MTFTHSVASNNFGCAKWIVSANVYEGTHTTIGAALTSASSGDTIFIRPGTYTENPTLKAGVNLTAFTSDESLNGTGNVIISGTCTLTGAGSVTITGIQLQTNSAPLLTVSGSAASIVNLNECYLNCTNNTGISYSSSSGSSSININNCNGNLGTTGIAFFTATGAGGIGIDNCYISNGGASTTASSTSACAVSLKTCTFTFPISTSSSGTFGISQTTIDTSAQNATAVTTAGTGTSAITQSYFSTGSASSISIGTGTTVGLYLSIVQSSNTNAITGAGTLDYAGLAFSGTSRTVNVTTQVGGVLQGGVFQAPSTGFIGEQIRSAVTAVSIGNNSPTNITSISITAGVWDISGIGVAIFTGNATACQLAISTNTGSLTGTVLGDSQVQANIVTTAGDITLTIPSFRVAVTSTTIYYLVGVNFFSTGSSTTNGRISATRVG